MAEFIKCNCGSCGAKYRLPVEFGGRTARCKKCGGRFEIPAQKSLEDSVLDWLSEADAATEEQTVEKPRVIKLSEQAISGHASGAEKRGPIRYKTNPPQTA